MVNFYDLCPKVPFFAVNMRKKNELTLSDAMQAMLKEYKLKSRFDETRVKGLWEQIMGKTIATYTSSVEVRRQVLYLTILSAPLKQELSFAKEKIIERINEAMGEEYIKSVVIQ